MSNHIKKIINAAIHFDLTLMGFDLAFSLHSSKTSLGIIFIAREIPAGIIIKSTRYPKAGIKSGIKSIGLKA